MSILGLRKPVISEGAVDARHRLKPTLSWPHLVALGVGAIVGTGIYTLIGVGADRAGPAVVLAFLVAGAVCACAALAYAEMATLMPRAGGAYTYSYAVLGETIAWVVGWSLILEYSLACSTVAVGWSGYLVGWLQSAGCICPRCCCRARMGAGSSTCPPWWCRWPLRGC
jgi:APA family basic amino acid/polyamine antiporter